MRFDSPSRLLDVIWQMRIADLPRGEDRATLQRLYNGEPPFDSNKAEENNVEINRNDLTGPNLLSQARRQWNQAFLKPGNFFTVSLDCGPPHKRTEYGHIITRNINRVLKRSRTMIEQVRAVGANTVLYGMGPVMWKDRNSPIPVVLPVSSLLIPSETEIDFENLEWFSVFREWTPSQLYEMTHGLKVDPGWNMDLVKIQLDYIKDQYQKEPNSVAYQYMPERIEELIKQDKGYWGTDAVPTVDAWDTFYREAEDGSGWYRRILLDWGLSAKELGAYRDSGKPPPSRNRVKDEDQFLYSSGKRKYCNNLSELLHCQFGDCSAYAPFKYHSVRSLGWMLWGVCDIQNRLYCKTMESTFEQLMWFFQTVGNQDFARLKKAEFLHFGIIPQGIRFLTAEERFKPDVNIVELAFARNRELMQESAASFTQQGAQGEKGRERTATEVMAAVNAVNALVSGMLNLAYTYEEFKYREICRRFCIKDSRDGMVRKFRTLCLTEGVPAKYLDSDVWDISAERTLGAGNKTLEMAIAQGLIGIRKNLNPDSQVKVDHTYIEALTDDPALAEDLAPIGGMKVISSSIHDAQLATERLMKGLQYQAPKDAVPEDYVIVWLGDMSNIIQGISSMGNMATPDQLVGLMNMGTHTQNFLKTMAEDPDEKAKVKQYQDALGRLMNLVKGFAQRLREQGAKGNGKTDPALLKAQGKIEADKIVATAKAQNLRESHSIRTAQKQASFEAGESRKDREHASEMRRESQKQIMDGLRSFQE